MFAWLDSASIACARLIRGTASTAKLVTPASASALTPTASDSGARKPISVVRSPSRVISSALGGATFNTTSAPNTSATSSVSSAPASVYASSGINAPAPAPRCTST
jgi:hypothetical protein